MAASVDDGSKVWGGIVADIRRAATARGRAALGCYSVEGTRVHERVLRAGVAVERAVASRAYLRDGSARVRQLLRQLDRAGCRPVPVPAATLRELTEGRNIGEIVGLVRLPAPATLDGVVNNGPRPSRLLVGVDVDDPGNVGALVRTALASGAAAYVAVGLGDPFHPRAVRTSMGSIVRLPTLRYADVGDLTRQLDDAGFRKVAAVTRGGTALDRTRFDARPVAVFVGSEAHGLSADVLAGLDEALTIPMPDAVDSFSVNAAAAVILYEARRGLREGGSGRSRC